MAIEATARKDSEEHKQASKTIALPKNYNKDLYERFLLWKSFSGSSIALIAKRLSRGENGISNYLEGKCNVDLRDLEKQIAGLLEREEDLDIAVSHEKFCKTKAAEDVWEVLQLSHEQAEFGLIVGQSGSGKTATSMAYWRAHREDTVFVTGSVVTRRPGSLLRLISKRGEAFSYGSTLTDLLDGIVDRFKRQGKLIIIDDAHFLSWEAIECLRTIHDVGQVGIVFLGQERLYDQMKGKGDRAFLYDQIYSRIGIKRDRLPILRKDVQMLADSIYPGLNKECIDFLFSKAEGRGRFRVVKKILNLAVKTHIRSGDPIDIDLLGDVTRFLMI
jgi:DNA transposition AAA+ family ATPase